VVETIRRIHGLLIHSRWSRIDLNHSRLSCSHDPRKTDREKNQTNQRDFLHGQPTHSIERTQPLTAQASEQISAIPRCSRLPE
jgi:hypothetical protein